MNKSIYEKVSNLRNRISSYGGNVIYDKDHLLLDEVLEYIKSNQQRAQEETYNYTVSVQRELEMGATIKKQEKLLELYKELVTIKDDMLSHCEVTDLDYFDFEEISTNLKIKIGELDSDE